MAMIDEEVLSAAYMRAVVARAELLFRTFLHTDLPLHAALVELMCRADRVPSELATVMEDIGHGYIRLAEDLNRELSRRDELQHEPTFDDADETRIEAFILSLIASVGKIELHQGVEIDGRRALEAFPMAASAIRTALLIERASDQG